MHTFYATRLAPSPTGALHLGHARTFLVTWWLARQSGAQVCMRMEDLDTGRARAESVGQAYEDVHWLGMDWDSAPPTLAGVVDDGSVVQSARVGAYEDALQALWERRLVYPCTCTRAEIAIHVAGAGSAPHESDGNVRYPGTCADRVWNAEPGVTVEAITRRIRDASGRNVCWRMRVPSGPQRFDDWIAGPQALDVAAEVGDFPVTRFVGVGGEGGLPAAYQLACVVDDHAMGIDLVVRGDDLLASTPRQRLIYEAMGWTPPAFAHVPLVIGADGKRLAKRHGESRIAQFRAAGVSAERIAGWVAWRSGQLDRPREVSAAEMVPQFDLARLPRERIVLTPDDLAWLR